MSHPPPAKAFQYLAIAQGSLIGSLCLVSVVLTWRRTRFVKVIVQLLLLAVTNAMPLVVIYSKEP